MLRKEFDVEFSSPVAVCDIEIGNNIKQDDGFWDYERAEIITLGILHGNHAIILQREKRDKLEDWKESLRKELENKPVMFALNTKMEKYSIKGFLGINRFFEEIQPIAGSGCSKDNFFNDLVKNKIVPNKSIPKDPFNGDSKLVINRYCENDYESIIKHNLSCLIKEYFIFMNKFWFLKKYDSFIKNGWWNGINPYGSDKNASKIEEDEDDSLPGEVYND